jgi:hypothetical protein
VAGEWWEQLDDEHLWSMPCTTSNHSILFILGRNPAKASKALGNPTLHIFLE